MYFISKFRGVADKPFVRITTGKGLMQSMEVQAAGGFCE
jgi:hypothetical protein